MKNNLKLKELKDQLSGKSINERLETLTSIFRDKIIFTSTRCSLSP